MLELEKNGYTESQIKNKLLGDREIKFEYDLLDKNDKKLGTLADVECSVSFSAYAEIKRSASFTLSEKEHKDIDFLNERIKALFLS